MSHCELLWCRLWIQLDQTVEGSLGCCRRLGLIWFPVIVMAVMLKDKVKGRVVDDAEVSCAWVMVQCGIVNRACQ